MCNYKWLSLWWLTWAVLIQCISGTTLISIFLCVGSLYFWFKK